MFHGGTSFGFMAGANTNRDRYQPDISDYDYDALLDQAGRPTPKFFAVRDVLKRPGPALPPPEASIVIPSLKFAESAPLWSLLGTPSSAPRPQTMESLGQAYGCVLYRTRVPRAVQGTLEIPEARDYAMVYAGGRRQGLLDRRLDQHRLTVNLRAGEPLDILVEAMGRVNFGPHSIDDWKGLGETVLLEGTPLTGWEHFSLPLDDLSSLSFSPKPAAGPAFHRATFELQKTGFTFFDTRGWGKGYLWVNGHNAGRYWSIGPQQSLFIPQEWLRPGPNELILLDLL
jgi:beta-galactosidase